MNPNDNDNDNELRRMEYERMNQLQQTREAMERQGKLLQGGKAGPKFVKAGLRTLWELSLTVEDLKWLKGMKVTV